MFRSWEGNRQSGITLATQPSFGVRGISPTGYDALGTRSHPEMVGDMSRVTYQKFLLCISSQGQDLYSHRKLNMYI